MSTRSTLSHRLFAAGWAVVAMMPLGAQTRSPFMPPATTEAAAAPTVGAPLQYKGFMEDANGVTFRIHDPGRKFGVWVRLNERDPALDVTLKQVGPNNATVTVEYQGRALTLALPEPKVGSSGSAAAGVPVPAAPPQMTNVPPAVTQAVVVNPTAADEQRRLQAVADEVARRRALREQAAQQLNAPPGAGAPGQPRRP